MKSISYISNKQLIFRIIAGLFITSVIILLLSSIYIKKAALNTLAQDDAKKTSELVFETMNTRMQEGWGKDDLNKILKRLELIREGMRVSSYRSKKVEEILGVVQKDKQTAQNDPYIKKAMQGDEQFIVQDDGSIRFLYPMKVSNECITCHYNTKVGDINGVLDISYPPSDIKISLDIMTYYFIGFFILFIMVFFYMINKKIVSPIVGFTSEIKRISNANNLDLKAEISTNIEEIGTLQNAFNHLLKTTKFYYDKLISSLYIDSLTNIPNFIKLQKDMDKINEFKEIKEFTFALLDIYHFKQINNFYGFKVGDFILLELAKLLEKSTFSHINVYRVHADQFALLFKQQITQEELESIINKINQHKFHYKFADITIKVKVGYINSDKNKTLEKAEMALAMAKKSNLSCMPYNSSLALEDEYMQHMIWTQKIEEALENDQIVPYFQPIKSTKTGKFEKYETLIRLIDEDETYTPDYFLEVAQKANIYTRLTQKLIKKTFQYFAQKDIQTEFSMNLALEDITNKETTDLLFEELEKYKYSSNVVIELLETQEISNFDALNDFINQVKSYGVQVAIDDFGSGYSNYNYILNLNIDIVKIDSSLIENIHTSENASLVVKNITQIAHSLGIKVVAEMVHTQEIEDIVTKLGIDYLQGFHIGKPAKDIII